MAPVVYATPELKEQLQRTINKFETILLEAGDKLPKSRQDSLRFIITQLREKREKRKLKASEWVKFRKLRDSAHALCELPQSGEPIFGGGSYLSTGRVGNFSGHG